MEPFAAVPSPIMERLAARGRAGAIAVVGASANPSKYGNIIVRNLIGKGFEVVPVNPVEKEIEGLPVVARLADLPRPVALAVFVVPPPVTSRILLESAGGKVDAVWLQEGSFDQATITAARANYPLVFHEGCIMVVTNYL